MYSAAKAVNATIRSLRDLSWAWQFLSGIQELVLFFSYAAVGCFRTKLWRGRLGAEGIWRGCWLSALICLYSTGRRGKVIRGETIWGHLAWEVDVERGGVPTRYLREFGIARPSTKYPVNRENMCWTNSNLNWVGFRSSPTLFFANLWKMSWRPNEVAFFDVFPLFSVAFRSKNQKKCQKRPLANQIVFSSSSYLVKKSRFGLVAL